LRNTLRNLVAVGYRLPLGGAGTGLFYLVMGIVMKKVALLATALAMVSGSALAADMRVKAVKAPPPPAFDPWDFAFGGGIANDYLFRGVTQSNHKPSVNVYFEPRYNVTKDFQLYVGLVLYGFSIALMVRSDLGLAPWDVLHSGLTKHFPIDIGQALVIVSFVVMLAWIPLREMPGVGTISNAIVIGVSRPSALNAMPPA